MQSPESLLIQFNSEANERLINVLKDIVCNVKINSDFSICHPVYPDFPTTKHTVEYLQKSQQIQQKYLSLQLRNFIYGVYYNGSMLKLLKSNQEVNKLSQKLENNTFLGVDSKFYQKLHQINTGKGYFEPGWYVIKQETDRSLAVKKSDLTLHIQRDKHLQPEHQAAKVGDCVAIKMPKNLVQNGFYIAVSNVGLHRYNDSQNNSVTVRIYFNLSAEGAIAVMGSLTQNFNELAIPYYFKVLYNSQEYERYDCGVLYFDKIDFPAIREVLKIVYKNNQSYFKPDIPLFTKHLAVGLGLAEEPTQKFSSSESFGMNRCQIIANGLLEAWYQQDDSTSGRIEAIIKQFSASGINLQHSYLNANSEDIYTQLSI